MKKGANIYWDARRRSRSSERPKRRPRPTRTTAADHGRTAPWWVSCLILTAIFVSLCVSINYRAFSAAREESQKHERLTMQMQNLLDENLALQDEIHTLKTDPNIIRREARRMGLDLQQHKVPVPAN